MGDDWTEDFRNGGVAEYILIEEKDDFCFSFQDTEGEEMKHMIPHANYLSCI